jgi:hypothetical protein
MTVLGVGSLLFLASVVVLAPVFFDSVNGPRFAIPGQRTLELETGTWSIYQHTGSTRGASTGGGVVSGGLSFNESRPVSVTPEAVSISGPAPAEVWGGWFGETITRGSHTYTGAVRFEVAESGEYTISVTGEPGEVLVARPLSDVFGSWPWMVCGATGGVLIVIGLVMWLVGASNRRVARRVATT